MNFYRLIIFLLKNTDLIISILKIKTVQEQISIDRIFVNSYLSESEKFKKNKFLEHRDEYKKLNRIVIKNIFFDTRKIKNLRKNPENENLSNVFVFIKGEKFNPYNDIIKIVKSKISILFIEENYYDEVLQKLEKNIKNLNTTLFFIISKNNRLILPWIIKYQYNSLDEKFFICGVTGTNGKTTTVNLLKESYNYIDRLSASIGTIGIYYKNKKGENKKIKINRTTPEIYDIYNYLNILKNENVKNIFIEASSIGSIMGRVDSISFDIIIFTNMTEDHLDFHKTLENYYNSKLRFIELLQKSSKKEKVLIFNHDDPNSKLIIDKINIIKKVDSTINFSIITYGKDKINSIYTNNEIYKEELLFNVIIYSITSEDGFMNISYKFQNNKLNTQKENKNSFEKIKNNIYPIINIKSNLIGEYNAYNIAAVLAVLYLKGIDLKSVKNLFTSVYVPGRLERIKFKQNDIYIDYAHTEDALENVLITLKNSNYLKIITVFGCGGDREKEKRKKMGFVADKYSDLIIVTNDNPRNEDEDQIIKMILNGIKNKDKVVVEKDRKKAIEIGINELEKLSRSCLLIAGKGHENYQEIRDEKIYFSDKNQVLEIIKK